MDTPLSPLDVTLGATVKAVRVVDTAARGTSSAARQALSMLDPLMRYAPRTPFGGLFRPSLGVVEPLSVEGAVARKALVDRLSTLLDDLVPAVLAQVLSRANVTDLVLSYVDLDAVAAGLDLDRAVATVDLDAIIDRVDVDAVVAKADLDAVIERVDVDAVVARADLDAVIERVDVDAVAARLDIDKVLDRMDLTSVVLERVDLDVLTEAILGRVDLIGLAERVIDGVDLPEIIRESSGTMASDTVQGVRLRGIAADDAVSRAVGHFRFRHGRHADQEPQPPVPNELTSEDVPAPLGVPLP